MSEDIRKRLAAAKADIEKKAGIKFSKESLALADLISEFTTIKTGIQVTMESFKTAIESKPSQSVGEQVGKPSDTLYFDP